MDGNTIGMIIAWTLFMVFIGIPVGGFIFWCMCIAAPGNQPLYKPPFEIGDMVTCQGDRGEIWRHVVGFYPGLPGAMKIEWGDGSISERFPGNAVEKVRVPHHL